MKAVVVTRYGSPDVIRIVDVDKPRPADNEVLIRVSAASVNPLDFFLMGGVPVIRSIPGLRVPKNNRLGCDIAGRVEASGKEVTQFKPGDEVFGATGSARGGFAEFACAPESRLARKPATITFEEAAALPVAALTALQALRDKGAIRRGEKVLIDGASGGVGTFAIQIAKSFGADVTAVCGTAKIETARSIGADHVIDYSRDDFVKSGERYDLILAANAHRSILGYRRALAESGRCVVVGGSIPRVVLAMTASAALSLISRRKLSFFIANINARDLALVKDLVETRQIAPVIDRRYPLSGTADALRYLGQGHARGKVVISVEHA